MTKKTRTTITCASCDQHDVPHQARGLCGPCYNHHHNYGTLHRFEPVRGRIGWQRHAEPEHPEASIALTGGEWRICPRTRVMRWWPDAVVMEQAS